MRAPAWLPLVLLGTALAAPVQEAARPTAKREVPPAPVAQVRHYYLNARVRPLLFWIRKNDVGEARITWRRDGDAAYGYEVLVGSDPLKAPRKINKWGYIAEHVSGADATIIGVMKQAKGDSVKDAEEEIAHEAHGGYFFETIRAGISGGELTAKTVKLRTPTDLTFRELNVLLSRADGVPGKLRSFPVRDRSAPGFLTALAGLLDETVSGNFVDPPLPAARAYIYNGRLYDLSVRSIKPRADFAARGRRFGPALDGDFVITNRATGDTTTFSIVYGRTGQVAAVPLKMVFRPKWWFEVELVVRG